jgi:biopolymer transport protein ExbB
MEVFRKFVVDEWYFAFPLFGMSLVAITLVVWRIMLNGRAASDLNTLLPDLQEKLQREGVEGALRFCKAQPDLIPRRILAGGLETSKQGLAAMRRSMANSMELEVVPELSFLLPTILGIAKIATMVGLLGTVISMIGTFATIQELAAAGKPITTQSGAIGLALFATALGLVTAIPLVFAHVLFKAWIANFEIKAKSAAGKMILLLQAQKAAPAKTSPTPALPETAVQRK